MGTDQGKGRGEVQGVSVYTLLYLLYHCRRLLEESTTTLFLADDDWMVIRATQSGLYQYLKENGYESAFEG